MTTPSENINDTVASFSTATWLQQDKVDAGAALAESDTPTYAAAVWANGVDNMFIQINEVFEGARTILGLRTTSGTGTANANADDVVIGGTDSGNVGLSFMTASGVQGIYFADSVDDDVGSFRYQHSTDAMLFRWNAVTHVQMQGTAVSPVTDGAVDLGTTSVRWGTTYTDAVVVTDTAAIAGGAIADCIAGASDMAIGDFTSGGGITLMSSTAGTSTIGFADGSTLFRGGVRYNHSNDQLQLVATGSQRMSMNSSRVDVSADFQPSADGTIDNGATALRWATTYTDALVVTDSINIDSGTSPTFDMVKGAATTGVQRFRTVSATDTTGDKRLYHDASEALHLSHYNGATWDDVVSVGANQLGFYGASPVSQGSVTAALTPTTHSGTPDTTLVDVSGSGADATINDNFNEVCQAINAIRSVLTDLGLAT